MKTIVKNRLYKYLLLAVFDTFGIMDRSRLLIPAMDSIIAAIEQAGQPLNKPETALRHCSSTRV